MFPFRAIRTSNSPQQQTTKVREELKELMEELNHDHPNPKRIAHEYWDVVQATSTLGWLLLARLGERTMAQGRLDVIERSIERKYYKEAGE
jgi:hypothetical protein